MSFKEKQKRRKPTKFIPLLILAFLGGYFTGKKDINSDYQPIPAHPIAAQAIKVQFSPHGRCMQLIKEAIMLANQRIFVHAYAFTSPVIAEELIKAHKRGIEVRILVDRSQLTAKGSQVNIVRKEAIPIAIDVVSGIAHNKVMIIDDLYVLTGSFNWSSAAATRNAENLLLITDKDINQLYTQNWQERAALARPIPD